MDDFEFGRPELTATLITMEFGNDGRIHQLWATDPALPEEGEDFQFVLPPIQFGKRVRMIIIPERFCFRCAVIRMILG